MTEHRVGSSKFRVVDLPENCEWQPDQLDEFLQQFKVNDSLRYLGIVSHQFLDPIEGSNLMKHYQLHDGIIAYIAMTLIANGSDHSGRVMNLQDLLVARALWANWDKDIRSEADLDATRFKQNLTQYFYQVSPRNLLARTLLIYRDLWPNNAFGKRYDVHSEITNVTGLSLTNLLVAAYLTMDKAASGAISIDPALLMRSPDNSSLRLISTFLDWTSANYEGFRSLLKAYPEAELGKYRPNPLIAKPVILPDLPATGIPQHALLTPIPRMLSIAATRGLYYTLFAHAQNPNKAEDNPFREAFGHVLEDYVFKLCEFSLRDVAILPQRKYGKDKIDTVDLAILKDDTAILVEIKQRLILKDAQQSGDLEKLRKSLKGNLFKGVNQLYKFRQDIEDERYEELFQLRQVKKFEHLIITHDYAYSLNDIVKGEVAPMLRDEGIVPQSFHWHSCSIDELEFLLGVEGLDLFSFLHEKRATEKTDVLDVEDFAHIKFGTGLSNKYLDDVSQAFLKSLIEK